MRKNAAIILGLIVVLGSAAVFMIAKRHELFCTRVDAERELSQARTAQEEWAAFDRIAQYTSVHFDVQDAAGQQVKTSAADWTDKVYQINFYQFGNPPLSHRVIEGEILYTLMRE